MPTSDLIYDVGMNNGDDTAYYLHRGYRVVAVEADPHLVEHCRRRFAAAIQQDRLIIVHCAIGPTPGQARFWRCVEKPEWNSFHRECATRNGYHAEPIEVEVRDFREILREHGTPHYLKIDIEGHDIHCLRSLDAVHLPAYVSCELTHTDEFDALQSLGFDRFKLVLQGGHQPLADLTRRLQSPLRRRVAASPTAAYLQRKAGSLGRRLARAAQRIGHKLRLAPAADWKFPNGSSGPFGEEAPGQWSPLDATRDLWLDHKRLTNAPVWCDIHATRSAAGAIKAAA